MILCAFRSKHCRHTKIETTDRKAWPITLILVTNKFIKQPLIRNKSTWKMDIDPAKTAYSVGSIFSIDHNETKLEPIFLI